MTTKRIAQNPKPFIFVEYYRATPKEARELESHLRDYEAVEGLGKIARKASGAIELGHVFAVYLLPVIVSYAGNKALKIVEDRVRKWFKEHGRRDQFITLKLSGQAKGRKIGHGKPRRYRY